MTLQNQICTIQDESLCNRCAVKDELNCRYEEKRFHQQNFLAFLPIYLPFFGITLVGFLSGHWWMLIYYLAVYLAVFRSGLNQLWLCRHCPYYARDCDRIFCGLHNGDRKIAKYSPKPLSRIERLVPIIIFPSLQLFPIIVEIYGLWYSYINMNRLGNFPIFVMGIIFCVHMAANLRFVLYLTRKMCTRCVNFSCLFNKVPSDIVDAYLENSPTMKAAWIASGYQMKTTPGSKSAQGAYDDTNK